MSAVLFIKPRWLAAESADAEIAAYLKTHPADRIMVLADGAYASADGERDVLPDIAAVSRGELLQRILRLRRTRYDEAVILAEESRDEMGYGEAKFWVFAARARRRSLGRLRSLSLRDELLDKWRRIGVQRIVRIGIRLIGRLRRHRLEPCAEREKRRLAAFTILHDFDRMFGEQRGRLTWGSSGAEDALGLAREMGWTVEGDVGPLLTIEMVSAEQSAGLTANLSRIAGTLACRGVALLRLQTASGELPDEATIRSAGSSAGLELVRYSPSGVGDHGIDAWLRRTE